MSASRQLARRAAMLSGVPRRNRAATRSARRVFIDPPRFCVEAHPGIRDARGDRPSELSNYLFVDALSGMDELNAPGSPTGEIPEHYVADVRPDSERVHSRLAPGVLRPREYFALVPYLPVGEEHHHVRRAVERASAQPCTSVRSRPQPRLPNGNQFVRGSIFYGVCGQIPECPPQLLGAPDTAYPIFSFEEEPFSMNRSELLNYFASNGRQVALIEPQRQLLTSSDLIDIY